MCKHQHVRVITKIIFNIFKSSAFNKTIIGDHAIRVHVEALLII